jgi:citrate synthase
MGMFVSTLAALSTFHPEANPALMGEKIYNVSL